ncbi:MAG: ParB/RepB/Spo0J family partition protein [Ruminococcus sp.]|nr:ParB/RepB/Spo0J family partition protein [Ruminococcus sp.]MBR4622790.1 ParB/RepB/Spo0J family partition protein [Ruminococcus sp.]
MDIIKKTEVLSRKEKGVELARVLDLPISKISPNPDQPRRSFSPESLTSLAKSIAQDGVIQPLTVREQNGGYVLVAGERRLRAARLAGLSSVPCVVVKLSDKRSAVVALIENIQRADLSFFEEAEAISSLINTYRMTQEEVALRLGMAQPTVANKLRLLKLEPAERRLLTEAGLSERHARTLLRLPEPEQRLDAIKYIIAHSLNVSQTESYTDKLLAEQKRRRSYKKRSAVLGDLRLFFNTVDKAVEVIRLAGVEAKVDKTEQDGFIEYLISIPKAGVR